jgi:hypothetical protein
MQKLFTERRDVLCQIARIRKVCLILKPVCSEPLLCTDENTRSAHKNVYMPIGLPVILRTPLYL